jgi:phosphatidylserine/phosphatidylglycerophosphate/cardiolipin synthase-like enzyme
MYVDSGGRDMVPFLEVLDGMVKRGIEVRLIHAKDPGPNWRDDFDCYPTLWTAMERVLCPRVHFKCIIVNGIKAYFGSANLTGAGMGAKSERKRNFENGVLTDDPALVNPLVEQFDSVWRGAFCRYCGRRDHCGDPVE